MFIKSVPGNTVEVLLWNHHLKENKLKRHVFLFKGFLLKTSWSVWQHIFICFLNNICSKKAWKDLCRQPCGEVSLSLVKSSLQNSLKIKINNFTFWLIIGCWTVCRWICFSSECLSLVQTVCVVCLIIQWQETQQYTQHCGCGDRSSGALMLKRENSTTPPREFCPGNIYQPADSHSGSRAREKLLCLWLFLQTLNLSSVVANVLLAASESLCLCACFVYPLFVSNHELINQK